MTDTTTLPAPVAADQVTRFPGESVAQMTARWKIEDDAFLASINARIARLQAKRDLIDARLAAGGG